MGAASAGKVYKKGKAPKAPEPDEAALAAAQPVQIRLTQPESKLYRTLQAMRLPFPLYAQYKQWAPGAQQPFAMDFALPNLRLDIEADGEKWHTSPDDKQSDNERDKKLAALGWTVIRFPESAINESIDQVQNVLQETIAEAMESQRKMQKKSSGQGPESFGVVYYEENASIADAINAGFTSYSKSDIVDNQEIKTG
jgi:very-short-patch-repair endonuclease